MYRYGQNQPLTNDNLDTLGIIPGKSYHYCLELTFSSKISPTQLKEKRESESVVIEPSLLIIIFYDPGLMWSIWSCCFENQ